jgi:hypothetical protein
MSAHLEKARQQFTAGKYKACVSTLWFVEPQTREGNLEAAEGLRELASQLLAKTDGATKRECQELFDRADHVLNGEARLRQRVGELGVSFSPAYFLGFNLGASSPRGDVKAGTLWFASGWIGLGTSEGEHKEGALVLADAVESVQIGGGRTTKAAGDLAAQFLLGGVAGLALGGVHETRAAVTVHARGGSSAHFRVDDHEPSTVRIAAAPLLKSLGIPLLDWTLAVPAPAGVANGLTQAAAPVAPLAAPPAAPRSATLMEELSQLADLHDRGKLADEEFAAAKAKLLDL